LRVAKILADPVRDTSALVNIGVYLWSAPSGGVARYPHRGRFFLLGYETPADFGKLIAEETEKWGKGVKFSGANPG
jgi:hypothetical protein